MAGACGAALLAAVAALAVAALAAAALAGASSVLGRLLDFWVCGDADEAARLAWRGSVLAEEALAAGSGE